MEREMKQNDALIDLGSAIEETKGIVGLARDADQTPLGGAGILDD